LFLFFYFLSFGDSLSPLLLPNYSAGIKPVDQIIQQGLNPSTSGITACAFIQFYFQKISPPYHKQGHPGGWGFAPAPFCGLLRYSG